METCIITFVYPEFLLELYHLLIYISSIFHPKNKKIPIFSYFYLDISKHVLFSQNLFAQLRLRCGDGDARNGTVKTCCGKRRAAL